ncbi:hypothetical protein VNO77_42572 [Canavalia gladiata]|uniref:Zinc finger PHD-type domain-containing protein n=1 Tax=Canavalia gladiata TaxID=3824 RepID=A0AAN9PNJ9_CANGL
MRNPLSSWPEKVLAQSSETNAFLANIKTPVTIPHSLSTLLKLVRISQAYTLCLFCLLFHTTSRTTTMQRFKEDLMVKPCDICGHAGFPETLVTCSKCNVNQEHVYCMRIFLSKVPEDWLCESCQSEHVTTTTCKVNHDIGLHASKRLRAVKTGKVKFLHEDEVVKLSLGNFSMKPILANSTFLTNQKAFVGSKNVISNIPPSLTPKSNPPISPPNVLGKLPRNGGVQKKPMTNQHASCPLSKRPTKECIRENQQPLGGLIPDKKVENHNPQKEKPTKGTPFEALSARQLSPIVGSGGILCFDAKCNRSNIERSNLQSIQENFNLHGKFLPSASPAWRGQFQISQAAAPVKFYDGFEAQPPCIVNSKAYKFSHHMPSVLQLESLPAFNVLTDVFQDDSPSLQDIALYFFPSEHTERSRKNLNNILKFMNTEKSMLRGFIDGVELLVFTSDQLDMDSRGAIAAVNPGYFLWGVFRQTKIDKAIERVPEMEPVDMDIDMIGGKDVVGRMDNIGNDKPNSLSATEYHKSLDKLDVPPGFEAHAKKT